MKILPEESVYIPDRLKRLKGLDAESIVKEIFGYLRNELEGAYYYGGGQFLDYSAESLQIVDKNNIIEDAKNYPDWDIRYCLAMVCAQEGSYFGEVILRNLGGKWKYCGELRFFLYKVLINLGFPFDPSVGIVLRKCGIDLDGRFIPVIRIAKLRLRKNKRVKSLHEVYEKIRTTGDWK